MGLRGWGILLLLCGVLLFGGAAYGLAKARAWHDAGGAACAPDDAACGSGRTYLLAVGIALLPFVTIPAMLLVIGGSVLWAIDATLTQRHAGRRA